MPNLEELRAASQATEAEAVRLQNEKDAVLQDIADQYEPQLKEAIQAAAEAQKAMCNAEALDHLLDNEEAHGTAIALGLVADKEEFVAARTAKAEAAAGIA